MRIMNIAGFLPLNCTARFLVVIQRGKVYGERYMPMYKNPLNGSFGSNFGVVIGITDDDFDELYELLGTNAYCNFEAEELTAPNLHNWK